MFSNSQFSQLSQFVPNEQPPVLWNTIVSLVNDNQDENARSQLIYSNILLKAEQEKDLNEIYQLIGDAAEKVENQNICLHVVRAIKQFIPQHLQNKLKFLIPCQKEFFSSNYQNRVLKLDDKIVNYILEVWQIVGNLMFNIFDEICNFCQCYYRFKVLTTDSYNKIDKYIKEQIKQLFEDQQNGQNLNQSNTLYPLIINKICQQMRLTEQTNPNFLLNLMIEISTFDPNIFHHNFKDIFLLNFKDIQKLIDQTQKNQGKLDFGIPSQNLLDLCRPSQSQFVVFGSSNQNDNNNSNSYISQLCGCQIQYVEHLGKLCQNDNKLFFDTIQFFYEWFGENDFSNFHNEQQYSRIIHQILYIYFLNIDIVNLFKQNKDKQNDRIQKIQEKIKSIFNFSLGLTFTCEFTFSIMILQAFQSINFEGLPFDYVIFQTALCRSIRKHSPFDIISDFLLTSSFEVVEGKDVQSYFYNEDDWIQTFIIQFFNININEKNSKQLISLLFDRENTLFGSKEGDKKRAVTKLFQIITSYNFFVIFCKEVNQQAKQYPELIQYVLSTIITSSNTDIINHIKQAVLNEDQNLSDIFICFSQSPADALILALLSEQETIIETILQITRKNQITSNFQDRLTILIQNIGEHIFQFIRLQLLNNGSPIRNYLKEIMMLIKMESETYNNLRKLLKFSKGEEKYQINQNRNWQNQEFIDSLRKNL